MQLADSGLESVFSHVVGGDVNGRLTVDALGALIERLVSSFEAAYLVVLGSWWNVGSPHGAVVVARVGVWLRP
eukprot:SAG25_NODE_4517_length_798_cov_1.502146_1_plen_73_part_00